jgi:predicted DNA-binding transcriptional regulator AlpA
MLKPRLDENERLISAPRLCERHGVCAMTLWRRERDKALGFPAAIVINRRKYFRLTEIEAWERAQASKTEAAAA